MAFSMDFSEGAGPCGRLEEGTVNLGLNVSVKVFGGLFRSKSSLQALQWSLSL